MELLIMFSIQTFSWIPSVDMNLQSRSGKELSLKYLTLDVMNVLSFMKAQYQETSL